MKEQISHKNSERKTESVNFKGFNLMFCEFGDVFKDEKYYKVRN